METLHIITFSAIIPFCCMVFYGMYRSLSQDITQTTINEIEESLLNV